LKGFTFAGPSLESDVFQLFLNLNTKERLSSSEVDVFAGLEIIS
jgi:hypothetical protein